MMLWRKVPGRQALLNVAAHFAQKSASLQRIREWPTMERMVEPSSGCILFDEGRCRSCALLPRPYSEQLLEKERRLRDIFDHAGLDIEVKPIAGVRDSFRNRSKAKVAIGGTSRSPVFGYVTDYAVVENAACPLYVPAISPILEAARRGIARHGLTPFDIKRNQGELKYVIVRSSERTGEAFVRLVLRSREQLDKATTLLTELAREIPEVVVTSINFQPVRTSTIEGPEEVLVSERATVNERYGKLAFPLSPGSFSQVTSEIAEMIYETASRIVARWKPPRLLDLYCGVGTFALACAAQCGHVEGVEVSSSAIENAKQAAALNGIENVSFYAADAEKFLAASESYDAAIVNPPRRGLGAEISERLGAAVRGPLLYSSCNPESFVRDCEQLGRFFRPVVAYPFDMFPNTPHVEVLTEFERKSG